MDKQTPATERVEKSPHNFWMATCGVDTYRRGKTNARNDTPWNAFTKDGSTLVCSLWIDQIVDVLDPQTNEVRRFVKLGGKLKAWKANSVSHGEQASENLHRATAEKLRIVGFEVKPNEAALDRGERAVELIYMDRAHRLQPIFGMRGDELKERLSLEDAFRNKRYGKAEDVLWEPSVFELTPLTGDIPGGGSVQPTANQQEGFIEDARDEADDADEDSLFDVVEERATTESYARKSIQILVQHVLQQQDDVLMPLTYTDLAERLGRRNKNGVAWARGLGHVLGRVTALIDSLTTGWGEAIPYLTTVVVDMRGPNRGLPGIGIRGKWSGYDTLTRAEKESKVLVEYQRILDFGRRWNDVLVLLGLPSVQPPDEGRTGGKPGGWGGGESPAHKALKAFVRAHPSLVGAESSWRAENEYALRSGDQIDVFFKSEDQWIGVEVKSSVSDGLERDYERGIYQVVKYTAVLEAQARADRPSNPPSVKVVLLLQSRLPEKYRAVAASLGVAVLENVSPHEPYASVLTPPAP